MHEVADEVLDAPCKVHVAVPLADRLHFSLKREGESPFCFQT